VLAWTHDVLEDTTCAQAMGLAEQGHNELASPIMGGGYSGNSQGQSMSAKGARVVLVLLLHCCGRSRERTNCSCGSFIASTALFHGVVPNVLEHV